jgi:hypothetical protein
MLAARKSDLKSHLSRRLKKTTLPILEPGSFGSADLSNQTAGDAKGTTTVPIDLGERPSAEGVYGTGM